VNNTSTLQQPTRPMSDVFVKNSREIMNRSLWAPTSTVYVPSFQGLLAVGIVTP
jgi:hypothetical protein